VDGSSGLVDRKVADRIALFLFIATFILLAVVIFGARSLPVHSTTVTTITQVVRGPGSKMQTTDRTQKVVADIVAPSWENVLGAHQGLILGLAAVLFGAYLFAAIVQRALLGRYAVTFGPISVPDLTDELTAALTSTVARIGRPDLHGPAPEGPAPEGPAPEGPAPEGPAPEGPAPEGPAPEGPAPEGPAPEGPAPEGPAPEGPAPEGPAPEGPAPEGPPAEVANLPAWAQVRDGNLALAGLRIDLETQLRLLAEKYAFKGSDRAPLREVVRFLSTRDLIEPSVQELLLELIDIGNRAAHGRANIDESALALIRRDGLEILQYLRFLNERPQVPFVAPER
jgi:hypothetical protein